MSGSFPALSWPGRRAAHASRTATVALTVALPATMVLSLAGCKGIDKSQWRDFPISTAEAARQSEQVTTSGGQVVIEQRQQVDTSGDSGVIGGAARGSHRSAAATVVVATDPSTCWVLVVDANYHRGCGNARISDVYGTSAGRVTKLSGTTPISLELISSSGQTVATGRVSSSNHYVTVRG